MSGHFSTCESGENPLASDQPQGVKGEQIIYLRRDPAVPDQAFLCSADDISRFWVTAATGGLT